MWCALAASILASAPASSQVAAETALTPSGFYIRADGSYQSVALPTYDLGWKRITFAPTTDRGPIQSHEPRVDGYGVTTAFGYAFRDGTFSPALGSNFRVELGGLYVNARGTTSATDGASGGVALQYVNGVIPIVVPGLALKTCPGCSTASSLSTDYDAWQINLKAASDHRFDRVTLTPSIAPFAGNTRNQQSFSQQLIHPSNIVYDYAVASSLKWTDWGAKLGLDSKFDVTRWLTFGVGGTVGWARRDVSMSANDTAFFPGAIGAYPNASTAAASLTTTAFLASAEANLTLRLGSNTVARAFGGLNYDSRVPGISTTSFSDPFPVGEQQTPAGIKFASETSYYAGGGVTVTFGP
jgi:hypothetical protein